MELGHFLTTSNIRVCTWMQVVDKVDLRGKVAWPKATNGGIQRMRFPPPVKERSSISDLKFYNSSAERGNVYPLPVAEIVKRQLFDEVGVTLRRFHPLGVVWTVDDDRLVDNGVDPGCNATSLNVQMINSIYLPSLNSFGHQSQLQRSIIIVRSSLLDDEAFYIVWEAR